MRHVPEVEIGLLRGVGVCEVQEGQAQVARLASQVVWAWERGQAAIRLRHIDKVVAA